MKARLQVDGYCECGWCLMLADDTASVWYCSNPECKYKGKKFKAPFVELVEVDEAEAAAGRRSS